MADIDRMTRALRKADAAGDEQGARVIARAIREAQQQGSGQPTVAQPETGSMNALGASVAGGNDMMMFGFDDEIMGGAVAPFDAAFGYMTGRDEEFDIGNSYRRVRDGIRARKQDASAQHPVASAVGGLAGGLAAGGTVGSAFRGKGIMQSVKAGAAGGGLYGAGSADEDLWNRGKGAGYGAALGAVGGAAAHGGLKLAQNAMAKRAIAKQVASAPAAKDVIDLSNRGFKALKKKQSAVSDQTRETLAKRLRAMIIDEDVDPAIHAVSSRVADKINNLPAGNTRISTLHNLRKQLASAADPNDQGVAKLLRKQIDKAVGSEGTTASRLFKKSLETHARGKETARIESMIARADNSPSGFRMGLTGRLRTELNRAADGKAKLSKGNLEVMKTMLDELQAPTITRNVAPGGPFLPKALDNAERAVRGRGDAAARKLIERIRAETALGSEIQSPQIAKSQRKLAAALLGMQAGELGVK